MPSRLRQLDVGLANQPGDPRIDIAEAEVALQLAESQRAAAAAARAKERAAALGAVALGLRAERLHAQAILRLDRREEARRDLDSVMSRSLAAGLHCESALARLAIGTVLVRNASNDVARRVLEQARTDLRAAGERRGEVLTLVELGLLAGKRGELKAGLSLSTQALQQARELGDRWSEGVALSQRLVLLNWADDEIGVTATTEPALAALRDSGNRQTLVSTLTNLAIASIERLELERANSYIDEAETLGRRIGSQVASSNISRARGYLEQSRGDLELARQSYLSGLERARRGGLTLLVAQFQRDLAWLELAAERPEEARLRANQAIETYRSAGDPRSAADTELVLAWAEARLGDAVSARRRLAALRKASADGSGSSEFTLLSGEARIAEALQDWRHAAEVRRRTIRMASEWQAAGLLMDQRIGLARALHGLGDRGELERLVKELLPEVERQGLRGDERDLRALLGTPPQ